MEERENILNYFNTYSQSLSKRTGVDFSKISRLRRKGYLFDRLVRDWHGAIGYSFPIAILVIYFVIGYYAGIYDAEIALEAKFDYVFWGIFLTLSTYLLDLFVDSITRVMQEADRVMNVKYETHNKVLKTMFGAKGIFITFLIALPFVLYDITGFGSTTEGWLTDIRLYYKTGDNSWYPHITETTNGIGFGSLLWLIVWIIPWFYFAAFIWLAFAFLVYMNRTLKYATWKDEIQKVVREKQYRHILGLSIAAYWPLAPFLAIKIVFQIFFIPWWSDTIATFLLFLVFIAGVIISPFLISREISKEKKKAIRTIQDTGITIFESTVKDVIYEKNVELLNMIRANLIYTYVKEITETLQQRVMDKKLIYKILLAALAPIISYIVKIALSIA